MSILRDQLVEKLEVENDALRGRIRDLEQLIMAAGPSFPIEWGLTPSERLVMAVLVQREQVTKDQIMAVLYRDLAKDEAEPKIVDVFVCKVRKKLKAHGIKIQTLWGRGYALDPVARARLRKEAAEVTADAA